MKRMAILVGLAITLPCALSAELPKIPRLLGWWKCKSTGSPVETELAFFDTGRFQFRSGTRSAIGRWKSSRPDRWSYTFDGKRWFTNRILRYSLWEYRSVQGSSSRGPEETCKRSEPTVCLKGECQSYEQHFEVYDIHNRTHTIHNGDGTMRVVQYDAKGNIVAEVSGKSKDGVVQGPGVSTVYQRTGRIVQRGNYVDGVLQGPGTATVVRSSQTRVQISGSFKDGQLVGACKAHAVSPNHSFRFTGTCRSSSVFEGVFRFRVSPTEEYELVTTACNDQNRCLAALSMPDETKDKGTWSNFAFRGSKFDCKWDMRTMKWSCSAASGVPAR